MRDISLSSLWKRHGVLVPQLIALLVLLRLLSPAIAEEAKPESDQQEKQQWVRLLRDSEGNPTALQTAIVRYEGKNDRGADVTVDLVGAVHVGDQQYYEQLNKLFEGYDVLLYELVAPKNADMKRRGRNSNTHFVGMMQNGMKQMLELEHQLEQIDYSKENFVHADMSPKEFAETMKKRGESFLTMFFRMMGQSMAQQSKLQGKQPSDLDILMALFDKNRAQKLKRIMAEQFAGMESMMVTFGGPNGSTIITERNNVALRVLSEQLQAGKANLGIFYGAGHMEDMDKKLRADFNLRPVETRWLSAWDLTGEK